MSITLNTPYSETPAHETHRERLTDVLQRHDGHNETVDPEHYVARNLRDRYLRKADRLINMGIRHIPDQPTNPMVDTIVANFGIDHITARDIADIVLTELRKEN